MKKEEKNRLITESQWNNLVWSYMKLYNIVDSRVSTLEDYFDTHKDYLEIEKARCLLQEETFDPKDYE